MHENDRLRLASLLALLVAGGLLAGKVNAQHAGDLAPRADRAAQAAAAAVAGTPRVVETTCGLGSAAEAGS
jgi:hypothetical protein